MLERDNKDGFIELMKLLHKYPDNFNGEEDDCDEEGDAEVKIKTIQTILYI